MAFQLHILQLLCPAPLRPSHGQTQASDSLGPLVLALPLPLLLQLQLLIQALPLLLQLLLLIPLPLFLMLLFQLLILLLAASPAPAATTARIPLAHQLLLLLPLLLLALLLHTFAPISAFFSSPPAKLKQTRRTWAVSTIRQLFDAPFHVNTRIRFKVCSTPMDSRVKAVE